MLMEGKELGFPLKSSDSRSHAVHPTPWVPSSSVGAYALDATVHLSPTSWQSGFSRTMIREVPLSLAHSRTLGILLFCGSQVGNSFILNKLTEERLESDLQEDGLSWLSMFKKTKRDRVLGSMPDGEAGKLGLDADLLLAV